MPSSLLSSVTLTLLLISTSSGQEFEGDSCVVDDAPGTCKILQQCPPVYQQLLQGNPPTKVCGYVGFDALVCCPTGQRPTTTTTRRPPTSTEQTGPGPLIANREGSVARAKCEEYARSVYQLVYPPILAVDAQPVNVSVCAIKSRKLIVGGKKADPKEFPHMAAVGYNSGGDVVWSCGGSLISEKFVLTAAHCLSNVNWGAASWVRVGDLNLERSDDDAKPQQVKVTERIRHPQYKRPAEYHDIGLLRLEREVTFNAWVRPGCLAYSLPDTGNVNLAIAAGWGLIDWEDETGSSDLLKVTINTIPYATCNRSFTQDTKIPRGIIGEWQLCAGEPGKDTCHGDSGGPLMILNQDYNCMYSIIGVTSFGGICGSIIPGVYTRVSNYLSWIEGVVWPGSTA
ncbi:venom protease-like [Nomia melanderi]|uniref:venom protease-like n=1 Tax=Nomia melanderi TaxID=2448451 RepID=UPI003FCC96AB